MSNALSMGAVLPSQAAERRSVDAFKEIFHNGSPLSRGITDLISSYLPDDEMTLFSHYLSPLPAFTNLTDPQVLKTYLGDNFQSQLHLSLAAQIAKRVYEAKIRDIGKIGEKYGFGFPMDPEVLAYAMRLAKDETVLEIAGASGENAILLAFAGARRVYMNDIEPLEIERFEALKECLPRDVRARLETVPGDCFEVLKKPELSNKVGLVVCRNLIHFFNNEQQAAFFKLLKTVLKPGGRAIFTVNSQYNGLLSKEMSNQNPDATSFKSIQCLVHDYERGSRPVAILCQDLSPCPDDLVSLAYTSFYIYERNAKTDFKWTVNRDKYQTLDAPVRAKVKEVFEANKEMIKPIRDGSVRILINMLRQYSTNNLSGLLKRNGFEVESTFVVAKDGHRVTDADLFKNGQQVGVIVRYPG